MGFDAGLIGFGPSRGSQVTFVLLEQWIPALDPVEPEHALRIVCHRFFRAHGPATPRDFAQWFAPRYLTPSAAAHVVESIAAELEEVEVAGHRCRLPADESEAHGEVDGLTVLLLPQYDCYLLGSRFGRETVVPELTRRRVSTYKNGRFEGPVGVPVLLVDGMVAGVWERQGRGKRVEIHVRPFIRLTPVQRESLGQAVVRIGSFLESPVAFTIDPAE